MDIRNEGFDDEIKCGRNFMKFVNMENFMKTQEIVKTDQTKKLPQPPLGHACKGEIIELDSDFDHETLNVSYASILDIRRSVRVFEDTAVTQKQLAFLLWSTQGIQEVRNNGYATFRPVPSGGARHPFELYFIARSVEGLKQGIYRYAPLEHAGEKKAAVEFMGALDDIDSKISGLFLNYPPKNASVILIISCVAYRSEWRYCMLAHRPMLIDLGHAGQNIMLSAAAMGLGSCCYAAFDQQLCDNILNIDGTEEYTVYVCSMGKPRKS